MSGTSHHPSRPLRGVVVLGGLVAVLAALASAAGIFGRGDLATTEFVTHRGEVIQVVTDGVYRHNAEGIVAEGLGWDIVTLAIVVPAMLVALAWLWRGSVRAQLVTAGLLAYFTYQYFQYAVFWAYGPLYPIHVLIVALSVLALGVLVHGVDIAALGARVGDAFPHRALTGFALVMVLLLLGLWMPVIGATLGGTVNDQLQGASTLVVPAFDLGLLVPLAMATALAVQRRLAVGYLLGLVVLVKGASLALAIAAMLVVEWRVAGELALPPLVVFGLMAMAAFALAARSLGQIRERAPADETVPPVGSSVAIAR